MREAFLAVLIGRFSQDDPHPPGPPRKILETSPEFALESEIELGETIPATPAVLERRAYVHTRENFIRLGDP